MAINIDSERRLRGEDDRLCWEHTMKSKYNWSQGDPDIEVIPSRHRGRSPEIHMTFACPDEEYYEVGSDARRAFAGVPTKVNVRVHGKTVSSLIDTLLEDDQLREYLVSAVDYMREHGKTKSGELTDKQRLVIALPEG